LYLSVFFRKTFSIIFFCFFLLSGNLQAQEYCWPTDASRIITSSFGEYRPGHIHGGIDIKTWDKEGYKVFAIGGGSVVLLETSPYGYGRTIHLVLKNGIKVIYGHLSRFSDSFQHLIQKEQERKRRFAVKLIFKPGVLKVRKGELIGYTGSSGSGPPHLHFEVRDSKNRPFNPFLLGYYIQDTVPPTLKAIAVSPLSFGSHVDGDFKPEVFLLQKIEKGRYLLPKTIKVWGRIGIALSAFDRADGATNKFSVYKIKFFVDGKLVFSSQYDRFSLNKSREVNLDRDYRLHQWGLGLFQKLYHDAGNELPFYKPAGMEAGVLCCWDGKETLKQFPLVNLKNEEGPVFLEKGIHSIRIEAMDYFGNISEATGKLEMIPLSEIWVSAISHMTSQIKNSTSMGKNPLITVKKQFLDETIRLSVESTQPLPAVPHLSVRINSWKRTFAPLIPRSNKEFVGEIPIEEGVDGTMITEVRFFTEYGVEKIVRDTLEVFGISPEKGGTIVSSDDVCRVVFPEGSVYGYIVGSCRTNKLLFPNDILGRQYAVYPDDVPMKEKVKIAVSGLKYAERKNKLGIYQLSSKGEIDFVGNKWKRGKLTAWTENLGKFVVLRDTVPPDIFFIRPVPGARIRNQTPRVVAGFKDSLSGIYGEDNYIILLDSTRLIVEYDPEKNIAFCQIEEPLSAGTHTLEVIVSDRAGNTARRKSLFYVNPE